MNLITRILLVYFFGILYTPLFAQDLSGCWSGKIVSDRDSFSIALFIEQEKMSTSNTSTIVGNSFVGNATLMDDTGATKLINIVGKITMKGIFYELAEAQPSVFDKSLGTLLKSKLKFEILENQEILYGSWDVSETEVPKRQISLTRCIITFDTENASSTDASGVKKKKYKSKVELKTDNNGLVSEVLNRNVKPGSTIRTKSKDVTLLIFDSRKEDGDSLTIIFNDKIVLHHYEIRKRPLVLTLTLDELRKKNSLIFFADNLGKIPPNTSTVSVLVNGKKIKDLNVLSNLESSDILYLEP